MMTGNLALSGLSSPGDGVARRIGNFTDDEAITSATGAALANGAEFQAFAELYEREFQVLPPTGGFPHIVAAKAWHLSGDRQKCFRHLNKAVDLNWLRHTKHLREIWPEFFWNPNLDEMEEWQALGL